MILAFWPLEVGVLANEINKKPMQYARLLRLAWRHRPWRQTILFPLFLQSYRTTRAVGYRKGLGHSGYFVATTQDELFGSNRISDPLRGSMVGNPLELFANATASLVGPSSPQGGPAQSMQIIQISAGAPALSPTLRDAPAGAEIAAAIRAAHQPRKMHGRRYSLYKMPEHRSCKIPEHRLRPRKNSTCQALA